MPHQREATGSWHFLGVPLDKAKADLSTLCPDGCVVTNLRGQVARFKDGHDNEQGTNSKTVSYDPELHSVWGKCIIDRQVSAKKPMAADITRFVDSL